MYLRNAGSKYSVLKLAAIEILSSPSTTAPVERMFSFAGISTPARRNCLNDTNLEREVLLSKNKIFCYIRFCIYKLRYVHVLILF